MKHILQDIAADREKWSAGHLIRLVEEIRPKKSRDHASAVKKIEELIGILGDEPELREGFNRYIKEMFTIHDPIQLYIESGIIPLAGFVSEALRKMREHILPRIFPEDDIRSVLNSVFYKKTDHIWVEGVPSETWEQLVRQMGILCHFTRQSSENEHFNDLVSAIQIISHRIAALGMAPEITERLTNLDQINSPFLEQNRELTFYLNQFDEKTSIDNDDYRHIHVILDQCAESLNLLRRKKNNFGTSLRLTNIVRRLIQLISRFRILLLIIHQNDQDIFRENIVILFIELLKAEKTRNSLRRHIRYNLELINFQIVEHTASAARHYIAENRKEFGWFFLSSLGGGVIVAAASMVKLMAYDMPVSLFGAAVINSLIYSVCFVSIHVTGATLATKVPSATAGSIASVIDRHKNPSKEKQVASDLKDLIIKIFRSQFIFFMGNLLAAFAAGYLITWVMINLMNTQPASPETYSRLINELHLLGSPSLFFAVLAGVFLFLSALVSGYYENRIIYGKIPERICASRGLRMIFSAYRLEKISRYIGRNTGSIIGNIALGLFFGLTPVIGLFFGVGLDTRHIAFATSNFGISFSAAGGAITPGTVFQVLISLSIIGFLNFIVSFGLALGLAIRSRNLNFSQTRRLVGLIVRHFLKHPVDFFFPPGENPDQDTLRE